MAIKAIAFDLDGTLYASRFFLFHTLLLAALHPRLFLSYARVRRRIRRLRPIFDLPALQVRMLADLLGCSPRRASALIRDRVYSPLENRLTRIRPRPHLRRTLKGLKAQGLKLAVLSDRPVERKLHSLGLSGIWDAALCSEESGYLKPNPEPFLFLCRSLGLDPAQVLYIGDKEDADIWGARRAGMTAVLFAPCRLRPSHADAVLRSFRDLEGLLGKLLSC